METESEEREACLRRHRERDGARWASPTVDQTQARLEHIIGTPTCSNLPLTVSEGWRVRWQKRVIHDSFSLLFQYFSRIYTLVQCLSAMRHGSVSHCFVRHGMEEHSATEDRCRVNRGERGSSSSTECHSATEDCC